MTGKRSIRRFLTSAYHVIWYSCIVAIPLIMAFDALVPATLRNPNQLFIAGLVFVAALAGRNIIINYRSPQKIDPGDASLIGRILGIGAIVFIMLWLVVKRGHWEADWTQLVLILGITLALYIARPRPS